MPTENRSSNTEMVSVLQREDRYIVIKRRDLERISAQHRFEFSKASRVVHERMFAAGAPARRFLVIESDWPEYEPTWAAIERRVTGSPAPQPHPEPIAWMVGTAIWWTKEEAERDAAETGKTITPIGPMSGIAPAEEHQGDPVAWRGINELGEVVTDWVDGVPPASMVDLCGNPASFAKIERAYTHADPGEVERLRENHRKHAARLIDERGRLRAQLAERDALLRDLEGKTILSWPDKRRISAALSASAEPIAPAAQPGKCLDGGDCGLGGTCKWCPHTSPSPARQPS